jgi:VCBS repeat-containing protein
VNDPPRLVATIPNKTMNEDDPPLEFRLTPEHFFDPDVQTNGDILFLQVVGNTNALLVTPTIAGGVLTLTLGANKFGNSQISVRATDLSGASVTTSFMLTVNPINHAPVARPDAYAVSQGGTLITTDPAGTTGTAADDGVLANDTDSDGDRLTAHLVTPPQFGTLTLNTNGTFTYRHNGLTRQTDTFTYRAFDGELYSSVTTVTITIGPPPPPPHQNPIRTGNENDDGRRDVNADGFITPLDALLVINFLNTVGSVPVSGLPAPPPFRDVNGDNFITALDALLVINHLNSRTGSGEGEGEAAWDTQYAMAYEPDTLLASAYAAQISASRVSDNASFSMKTFTLEASQPYGPQPVESMEPVASRLWGAWQASDSFATSADLEGLARRGTEEPENASELFDSALADLLWDLSANRPGQ